MCIRDRTLDARVVAGDEEGYFENGKVLVGALHPDRMKEYIGAGDLVILGNREEDHLKALEEKASCLVICLDSEVSERVLKVARQQKVTIIVTPFDTFTAVSYTHLVKTGEICSLERPQSALIEMICV